MAWDFSTEPDFEQQLEWMASFVRDEIWPLETLDLGRTQLDRLLRPLQEEVRARGLWAAHLPPDLGGQGFGPVKLGLMHEILGSSPYAPSAFGNQAPDTGNSELIALAGSDEQKERWLHPLLAGDLRSAVSMTEPGVAGADRTTIETRAALDETTWEWVIDGHKWFSMNASLADFLIVMAVTDPDSRPHQRASMLIVPADTPRVRILRDVPTMEHPREHFGRLGGHAEIVYENARVPADSLLGPRGAGFPLAQARLIPGRIHHCMRWLGRPSRLRHALRARDVPRLAWLRARRQADRAELDRRLGSPDAGGPAHDAARGLEDRLAGRRRRAQRRIADQVLRRAGAARRHRPRAADPRLARLFERHAAGGDVPLRPRRAPVRRPRRGHRQSVARQILRAYEPPPDAIPSEHVPTRRAAAQQRFAEALEAVTSND